MKSKYIITSLLVAGLMPAIAQKTSGKTITSKEVKTTKVDRSKRPQPGPAPEIKLGKAEKFVLPNGLTVFLVENHKFPKVTISLSLDVDPILEGEKNGYVDFAGQLLGTATKTMTKDQINEKVDFIGASLSAYASGASGSCLKKHLDGYMKIFSDVILNPVFKQEELDKIKKQTKTGLATGKTSPNAMMDNLNRAIMYGKDHPYGEVQTEEHVDKITLEDCQGYYNSFFKPNIGYMTIVGDITIEEAKTMMNKYFGEWAKADVKQKDIQPVGAPLTTKVSLVNKPGAAQSTVRITYPIDFKPGSPDEIKVSVMNDILGGGATGRLFRNLRETYNFTYGAYSRANSDEFIGTFSAAADVRTSATDSSVNEFLKELVKIKSEKVTQEELDAAKKGLAGNFSIALERPSTIARFALNMEKYKLPADYYQTYLARLAAVTIDDVYEMANKYIKPENAHILVVGDQDVVLESLKKYSSDGKVKVYDYKGDPAISIKPAPAGVTAETVLDGYINAIGGKKAILAVKDETMTMEMEMMGQKVSRKSMKKAPNKMKEEITMGAMVVQSKVCDGKSVVTGGMQGSKTLEGKELADELVKSDMYADVKQKELGYKHTLLGIDNLNGVDVFKVEVVDPSGDKSTEYYDTKTYLKLKSEAVVKTPRGEATVSTEYKDYKKVGSVMYPHSFVIDQGGMLISAKVLTLEVNKKLKDSEFEIKK